MVSSFFFFFSTIGEYKHMIFVIIYTNVKVSHNTNILVDFFLKANNTYIFISRLASNCENVFIDMGTKYQEVPYAFCIIVLLLQCIFQIYHFYIVYFIHNYHGNVYKSCLCGWHLIAPRCNLICLVHTCIHN